MTSVIIFWTALLGLVSLFAFKMFELKNGELLGAKLRKRVDVSLVHAVDEVRTHVTELPDRASLRKAFHTSAHAVILFFSKVAKFADVKAESLAMRISRNAREHTVGKKRQASDFLRQVSEHKNGLDKDEIKRETDASKLQENKQE